jgi:ubiquitin C-terminal hydrolase
VPRLRKIRGLVRYPEKMDLNPDLLQSQEDNMSVYELVGVAVHLGTILGGHYVAYVKKEDGEWYCTNDERVGRVSRAEVLQQDAYLLFYSKFK